MDEFLTDDQQADRAKQWLRENGVFVVAGIVLGLALLFGWQRWEEHKLVQAGEASVVWEQLRSAIEGERYNEVDEILALLESDYATTPYLDQGRLAIARMHMDRNSPEEALNVLNALIKSPVDNQLLTIAELRIAQIYLYQERFDEALAILGPDEATPFVASFHELRGDIFFAQGQLENALDEYQLALDKDKYSVIDRAYVQIKLDDVSGSIAVMVIDEKVEPVVQQEIPSVDIPAGEEE
ncbi:MAG: tetratricopeptide repeat protein [Gammaproteobacteria bacterium]|nr:tetratricopeptide repeat protein [Gammaproteobacteria bacterium]MCP4088936.1 tetratricopeptide repeat protein [Gammaproteobacteria bacterium]MCP4274952.1 tetratricopeptide repeat protein [Gammaproteobacteria bacterium]MCP4831981.1 tetratricopeptide repeat protein [Gammaproteobacteria bacterium]MCP4929416.1 tetratricopeptide repeat protein [Gammaproteobacteria bacterium]